MATLRDRTNKVAVVAAGLLLGICGCVRESNENGERTYQYELWIPISVLVLGLGAIPVGLALCRKIPWLGWGLVIIGPLGAIFLAPSLFRDQVVVGNDGFQVRTGIWGLTAVHALDFKDIKEIRITSETTQNRGQKRTNYFLNCEKKSGGSSKVPVNNAVTNAAAEAILRQAEAHKIPIRDETGGR